MILKQVQDDKGMDSDSDPETSLTAIPVPFRRAAGRFRMTEKKRTKEGGLI